MGPPLMRVYVVSIREYGFRIGVDIFKSYLNINFSLHGMQVYRLFNNRGLGLVQILDKGNYAAFKLKHMLLALLPLIAKRYFHPCVEKRKLAHPFRKRVKIKVISLKNLIIRPEYH